MHKPTAGTKRSRTQNAHSHPSGDPTPSPADQRLTDTLKAALACIDVRLIDHLVVAGSACASFAEAGLL